MRSLIWALFGVLVIIVAFFVIPWIITWVTNLKHDDTDSW